MEKLCFSTLQRQRKKKHLFYISIMTNGKKIGIITSNKHWLSEWASEKSFSNKRKVDKSVFSIWNWHKHRVAFCFCMKKRNWIDDDDVSHRMFQKVFVTKPEIQMSIARDKSWSFAWFTHTIHSVIIIMMMNCIFSHIFTYYKYFGTETSLPFWPYGFHSFIHC